MAIRTSEHSSTGYSPAMLNYGRDMNRSMENALCNPKVDIVDDTEMANFVFENQNHMKKIRDFVFDQIKKIEKETKIIMTRNINL